MWVVGGGERREEYSITSVNISSHLPLSLPHNFLPHPASSCFGCTSLPPVLVLHSDYLQTIYRRILILNQLSVGCGGFESLSSIMYNPTHPPLITQARLHYCHNTLHYTRHQPSCLYRVLITFSSSLCLLYRLTVSVNIVCSSKHCLL